MITARDAGTSRTSGGPAWLVCISVGCVLCAGGCSSVIGSAYLRDAWLDAVEHAAETRAAQRSVAAAEGSAVAKDDRADVGTISVSDVAEAALEVSSAPAYATIDEALAAAARLLEPAGGLRPQARDTLAATLQGMPTQDWPVAIEEFTAALAAAAPPAAARAPSSDEPTATSEPIPPLPPAQAKPEPVEPAAAAASTRPEPPQPPETPALAVQNACFATRVRAWGSVDRFEDDRFTPGQEVIVYFELDRVAATAAAEGHTTRVQTRLELVGADGSRLHQWAFEPVEETSRGRRRDYFARYVLTLPDRVPAGPCRLQLTVTDAVAHSTAQAMLPLEIVAE